MEGREAEKFAAEFIADLKSGARHTEIMPNTGNEINGEYIAAQLKRYERLASSGLLEETEAVAV